MSSNINIKPQPVNPQKQPGPSSNPNQQYSLETYIGETFQKKAKDTEGYKKPKKQYTGKAVYFRNIDESYLRKNYSEDFVDYIIQTSGYKDADSANRSYKEVLVFIPEISGCLPIPDLDMIDRFSNDVSNSSLQDSGQSQSIAGRLASLAESRELSPWNEEATINNLLKQISRLSRLPRFYGRSSITEEIGGGDFVIVEFPNENDYTVGIIKQVEN